MKRRVLARTLGLLLATACVSSVLADPAYPNKPVKILVGYAAGGPTDMVARMLAIKLQDKLGQPFIVENRAGAGSNIASEAVAAAAPDGYTLLMAAAPITMNVFVYKNLKYHPDKSFEPISQISSSPGVFAVAPNSPFKTVGEVLAYARSNPGRLNYGTTGVGGSQHMATELLQSLTKTKYTHVPYKGASAVLTDLMSGHIDIAFMTASGAMPHLQSGKVKPLAVAGETRLTGLPNLPTFTELGIKGMVSDSWNGLLAPAGTPPSIIRKLFVAVNEVAKSPDFKTKLQTAGAEVIGSSPEEFQKTIRQELVQWEQQFKEIKIELQ